MKRLASHVLPWSAAAFLLIVPSGLMMFTAHASDFISSPVFAVKMCLIMAAGVNAGALPHHRVPQRGSVGCRGDAQARTAAFGARLRRGFATDLDLGDRLRALAGPFLGAF